MDQRIHDIYEQVYIDLKQYLLEHSLYKPDCKKIKPNEVAKFPLVTCVEGDYDYSYTTQKYTDEIYNYNLMEINIFAQNKSIDGQAISGMTIKDEIRSHIEKYFHDVFRLRIKVIPNAPNLDDSIFRCVIYVSCKVDTKYKDKLVLYPR